MTRPRAVPPVTQAFLDRVRQDNLGHRLLALATDFEARVLKHYATMAYGDIRPVHGAVLRNLELQGTRLTTLAQRAGITHRAMAKIVNDINSLGYIEYRSDPEDGRATVIVFTDQGLQLLNDSSPVIEHICDDYAKEVGGDNLQSLDHCLRAAIDKLGIEVTNTGQQALHPQCPSRQTTHSGTYLSNNLGRYLTVLAKDYDHRCTQIMLERGHKGIRFDHLAVLSHLDVMGMKHSTLAQRAGISLQAIGKQVRAVEQLGYVVSEVDSDDKRARRIHFSAKGFQFIADLLDTFEQIKADYTAVVGRQNIRSLQRCLEIFVDQLQLPVPVKHGPEN
ncbi:MAG: MarR family transcriptional regulator [Halieaceae bacterium]|jgi:DNA-binding MarR family transcriptional regulator|nr:MarR family transcriptional regulator [Halieaceae bacterium]